MTGSTRLSYAVSTQPSIKKQSWTHQLDSWALIAFASSTCFLFGYGQQRSLAIALALAFLIASIGRTNTNVSIISRAPPEIWLYSVWAIWSVITGMIVAVDLENLWIGVRMILQMLVMIWLVYAVLESTGNPDVISIAMIVGGLVQIVSVASTGSGLGGAMTSGEVTVGLSDNPNGLGFVMVWCAASALYFWNSYGKWVTSRRLVIIILIILCVYVMFASGSRKSTLAMALLLFMWVTFGGGKEIKGVGVWILPVVMGALLMLAAMSFAQDFTKNTPVGRRFEQYTQKRGGDLGAAVEDDARYEMHIEGIKMSIENPIAGVGVNNFGNHFRLGCYSHSNYIEPLATTGLIGFVLFQSFYFILIFRIRRLLRADLEYTIRYRLKIYLMTIVAICVIGVGAPHYAYAPVYLILTAITVYTSRVQREMRLPTRSAMRVTQHT